jgi:hypothetical protein
MKASIKKDRCSMQVEGEEGRRLRRDRICKIRPLEEIEVREIIKMIEEMKYIIKLDNNQIVHNNNNNIMKLRLWIKGKKRREHR